MTNPTQSAILDYLQKKFAPEVVLLGGSRATHSERGDSDWDLYLVGNYPQENERVFFTFEGAYLDVALFPKDALTGNVLRIYYGPLKSLKVILDNDAEDGKAIVLATESAYERGPGMPSDERWKELQADASRRLSKVVGYAQDPSVAVFHMSHYYQAILPAWFELQGRWSLPPQEAIPIIRQEDPEFSAIIESFCTANMAERIDAGTAIFAHLFGR